MAKMPEIETKVLDILLEFPDARANDFVLYAKYIQKYNAELKDAGLIYALMEAKRLKMPNYESVTRARRKIQEKIPSLKPPKKTRQLRADNEARYRAYARTK